MRGSVRRRTWAAVAALASAVGLGGMLVVGAAPAGAAAVSSCKPTAAHPYPVVLVHGTFESSSQWDNFAPTLTQQGYCVSRIDYSSTQDIAYSAANLRDYVNQVLAATGAGKVDLVGHSQGGMMPRYYIKNLGGASKVDKLVAIAPSNYGTTLQGLGSLAAGSGNPIGFIVALFCTSCDQQVQGSDFLTALNAGSDTPPGPTYTVIETKDDEVVTPYTNAFLKGNATNITVQDSCPGDTSGHVDASNGDPNVWWFVYKALDPSYATPLTCVNGGAGI